MKPQPAATALAADVAGVLLFCALGRRSHDEGLTLDGLAHTAWPFVSGTLIGWAAARAWRAPAAVAPTGVIVWLATVVGAMLLRKLSSQGVAPSFVVVATLVTAVLLLGWRAVVSRAVRVR